MIDSDLPIKDIMATIPENYVQLSQNWLQGRTGFGGLVAAVACEHMHQQIEDKRTLRSFMGSFVAPTPAEKLSIETNKAREGKNVTQLSTNIIAPDGQLCFQSLAAFGVPRETRETIPHELPMKAEARDSAAVMERRLIQHSPLPNFLVNFDIHWTGGGIPMSGMKERRVGMWVKHNGALNCNPLPAILALADIPPAAVMSYYTSKMVISSLTWMIDVVAPMEQIDGSGWFYIDYKADAAAHGYSQQSGTIHAEDGTLVALSRQCMCYFD
ncbi:thioesterase family protein [Temperatibacter marinus]|uniref:Thioesterase family protein n=1 Tax=Temperatibacter marinus TaxID=1456591 RepID=A0AA52EF63_9PROT|nr:thioesterase family protein [Temperatibacter marinus]WND01968.1 thioesterase family protein [Temperatibacter marinus]